MITCHRANEQVCHTLPLPTVYVTCTLEPATVELDKGSDYRANDSRATVPRARASNKTFTLRVLLAKSIGRVAVSSSEGSADPRNLLRIQNDLGR